MHILEASLVARNEDGSVDIRRLGEQASSAFYPLFYVEGLQAAALFYISQAHGLKGANAYFAGTAEAGAEAIGRGYRAVRRGEVEWALAGGYDDASSWWNVTKFEALGVLSEDACRPYDAARDGTVLGEGAAFLVLEPEEAARSRGARIYAEVAGFGGAYDTYALITPHPEGRAMRLAIEAALREARLEASDIGFVAGHGSGTIDGDRSEARALAQVFDGGPAVTSVKGATGHLVGAAGALNAAVAALALATGRIPPTLGCDALDPECAVDVVTGEAREAEIAHALAVARGFEGQHVALALRKEI
jgi:3-oxoacyl-[acyl-carrier-protein] synthase II